MSYDLYLRDPATHEMLEVPGHLMYGGNIGCKMIDGHLVPTTTTRAYLNITYNYGDYYWNAFPGVSVDEAEEFLHEKDCKTYGIKSSDGGIRSLNGLSGAEAIPVLREMINRIEQKYKVDNEWISTNRGKEFYQNIHDPSKRLDHLGMWEDMWKHGSTQEERKKYQEDNWELHVETYIQNEGDTADYWCPTAANAIRPLYQLIALSTMRPDGVWSEES